MEKKTENTKGNLPPMNTNQKLVIRLAIVAAVVVLGLIFVVPIAQANIRSSQIESLVQKDISSKKVKFADLKTIDKEIEDSRAITVLFSTPDSKAYNDVLSVLKNEELMKTFSRNLTVYPIIYDASKIEKKYNIKKDDTTVIFFEGGTAKNSYVVDTTGDVKTAFIPAVNQLPLAAAAPAVQQDQGTEEPQTEQPQEGTASTETEQPTEEELHQQKLQTIQ